MSRYAVEVTAAARKQLRKLPREVAQRVGGAIARLADNPRHRGTLKLEGDENLYRVRVGEYRILYSIFDKTLRILVVRVAHRKDAYE